MTMIDWDPGRQECPIDRVETVASFNDWLFERNEEDEITIAIEGEWANYHVTFSWQDELEALHFSCAFDLKTTAPRFAEVLKLTSMINEQIVIGHFDIWQKQNLALYRNSLLLTGGLDVTPQQAEQMLALGVDSCERYYQAFQFVIWAGKPADDVLKTVLFETVGEA